MYKTNKNITANLIVSTFVAVLITAGIANATAKTAFADCEQNYGGGQTCTFKGKFKIEKWVKLEDDNTWKSQVTVDLNDNDDKDKDILFKVKVTAGVEDASGVDLGTINFDDLKVKDSLPDELKFLEDKSNNDLTEEFSDFKPGDSKTFYYTAKIRDSEKNKDGDFEKCVVNKATLYYKGDKQGSDTAVVCYKKSGEVLGTSTELPRTGAIPTTGIVGLAMLSLGTILKLKKQAA